MIGKVKEPRVSLKRVKCMRRSRSVCLEAVHQLCKINKKNDKSKGSAGGKPKPSKLEVGRGGAYIYIHIWSSRSSSNQARTHARTLINRLSAVDAHAYRETTVERKR